MMIGGSLLPQKFAGFGGPDDCVGVFILALVLDFTAITSDIKGRNEEISLTKQR